MSPAYMIQSAGAIRRQPLLVPDGPGLYAFLLNDASALDPALDALGLQLDSARLGAQPILYLGCSRDSLRRRLKTHLSHDTARSTFRMSLGAVLSTSLQLTPRPVGTPRCFSFDPPGEQVLSAWIDRHVSVALRVARDPAPVERDLIQTADPVLNISGRRNQAAWTVSMLRRRCRGQEASPC